MAKYNIAKAKAAGANDQQIQQFLSTRPDLTPYDPSQAAQPSSAPAQGGGITDWLPTAGSVVGGIAGAELGPVGAIGGSALGGAGGEWLRQLITGQKSDIGSIAKEGALGGVGGAAGEVIGPAFKAARSLVGGGAKVAAETGAKAAVDTGGNVIERLGKGLQKSVTNPKVAPSATSFGEEAALMDAKNAMGIHGPAEVQRAQSNIEYKRLVGEMQNKLAVNNPPLDGATTKQAVQQAIEGTLNFDAKSPAWKRALDLRKGQMGDIKNTQELLKYKLDLGNKLGRVFRKIETGTDLTTQEEAALATWQSVDRIITQAAPELKDLTTQMSVLHKIAPGLKSSAAKGAQLELLGTKIPFAGPVLQGASDTAGRALQAVGGSPLLQKGADIAGKAAAGTAIQTGTRSLTNNQPQQAQAAGPMGDFGDGTDTTQNSPTADFSTMPEDKSTKVKKAFLAAMLASPKQAATLQKIYEFGFGDKGAGSNVGKVTAKDYALAQTGLNVVKDVKSIYKEDPNVLTKQLLPGQFASRKFDSALYDAFDTLLRLRTGAQANPDEIRGYMSKLGPTFGDSPEVVKYKLNKLESDLQFYTKGGSASDITDFLSGSDSNSPIDQYAQ